MTAMAEPARIAQEPCRGPAERQIPGQLLKRRGPHRHRAQVVIVSGPSGGRPGRTAPTSYGLLCSDDFARGRTVVTVWNLACCQEIEASGPLWRGRRVEAVTDCGGCGPGSGERKILARRSRFTGASHQDPLPPGHGRRRRGCPRRRSAHGTAATPLRTGDAALLRPRIRPGDPASAQDGVAPVDGAPPSTTTGASNPLGAVTGLLGGPWRVPSPASSGASPGW